MALGSELAPFFGAAGAAGGAAGYEIERSLRFNSADSAYLSRTPSSAGNRKTWTFSTWAKLTGPYDGTDDYLLLATAGPGLLNYFDLRWQSNIGVLRVGNYSAAWRSTTAVFRDPSAWYHIVVVWDTTQTTPANRVRLYVNGVEQTDFDYSSDPNLDDETTVNNTVVHRIGNTSNVLLADFQLIDGAALDPTDFGAPDETTGVWNPIEYTGDYNVGAGAVNGFHLDFADNSSAAALGYDTSGNGNDWTVNNISPGGLPSVGGYTIPIAAYLSNANYIEFPVTYASTTTYELFVRITNPATYIYFAQDNLGPTYDQWNIGVSTSDSLLFGSFNSGWTTFTSVGLTDGSWHFVRLTTTGSSTSLYVDGVLVGTNASGGSVTTGTQTNKLSSAGAGTLQVAHLRITSGGTPPTTGIPDPSTMNTAAGSGGTLLFYDALDSLSGTGTITSDGGGVTITVTNAVSASTAIGPDIDSLRDSPTNGNTADDTGAGGEVPGNYATLNPLDAYSNITLSQGNLRAVGTAAGFRSVKSTIAIPNSGQWYFECSTNDLNALQGIATAEESNSNYVGATSNGWGFQSGGYYNSSFTSGVSFSAGDILNFAVDRDNQKLWFGVNGTWVNSGNPATGVNATFSNLPASSPLFGMFTVSASSTVTDVNFGQRSFAYSAPSGFKAVCTANLDDPTIADPSTVMDVALWTGNGSTQNITTDFSPDFVWIKSRSAFGAHNLFDAVRGATNLLETQNADAETTNATTTLTSFNSDGFSLSSSSRVNGSGTTYVGWTWDAGTSNAPNTDGTITSTVRANTSARCSVVTYTGTLTASTVGHGLGVAPQMIIIKDRTFGYNWQVYHHSIGNSNGLLLNTTDAAQPLSSWNNTSPTPSVFSLGAVAGVNNNGAGHVAYCFAPVESYSAFGSYTGNGTNDGPLVYTGFRPKWVMIKGYVGGQGGSSQWLIIDTSRDTYNVAGNKLAANLADQENSANVGTSGQNTLDILSNGFKPRTSNGSSNDGTTSYVWAAFAENPFKYARAR